FRAFNRLQQRNLSRSALSGLGVLTSLLWLWAPIWAWLGRPGFFGLDASETALGPSGAALFYEVLLFPLTVVTLALWEARRGTLGKRLAVLGNISYSSYLLHFPLQLVLAEIVFTFAPQSRFFYTPAALLLFFLVLIPLCIWSYHYVERPCQAYLRKRLQTV
ncbi:MAG: hypothetical protein H7Y43_03735, partial [Akkermansiaceae bacterium]|nr:hypothetical protein [Verrucomicrobiales bacterium]